MGFSRTNAEGRRLRDIPRVNQIRAMPEPPPGRRAAISSVASYVPDRVITNAELSKRLDTSDDWIGTRTGIPARRGGGPGETTSTMGAEAVRRLMVARGLEPGEVDALIVATATPDMMFP